MGTSRTRLSLTFATMSSARSRGTSTKLIANAGRHEGVEAADLIAAGRRDGLEPADVIGAIVDHSHLEGEDIRGVRVLERFSFAEVPADRAGDVVRDVAGKRVRGQELRLEVTNR